MKQLRELFRGGTAVGLSDGELLHRYVASHDGLAFEALVSRHGPMVVATCRAVLRDHHDVEDAFQATFLVLARRAASIRGGDALGGWLHRVARRVAVQLNIEAKRRRQREEEAAALDIPKAAYSESDFDVRSIMHEEIDRLPDSQRLVVVLCELEGLTYEQAAGRLHLTAPTVYHRLAKGRKRLRDRLIRRGVTASAIGAATELSRLSAMGTVPSAWMSATVALVTGGPLSCAVADLAHVISRSVLMARLKIVAVIVFGAVALASAGFVAVGGVPRDDGKSASTQRIANPAPTSVDQPQPGIQQGVTAAATAPPRSPLTIEARDLFSNAPINNVRLEFSTDGRSKKTLAATDAAGTARFSRPSNARRFWVTASCGGFVSQVIRWDYDANAPGPPDRLLFQMEKATTISGRVVDQDEKPIAGATVVVDVSKGYPKSRQWVDFKNESVKTDANGRWSFYGVPEKPDSVELAAYDYLYLGEQASYHLKRFNSLTALRDGSATLRLERGTRVEGTVRSPNGQAVAGAEVFYGKSRGYSNSIPPLKADARGRFMLGVKPGTITTLTARAGGFGPAIHTIRVGTEPLRADLTLSTAHPLKGRIVDSAGKPIAHATIIVSWSGPETSAATGRANVAIAHELSTDGDGRFVWKDAPGSGIRATAYANGFALRDELVLMPDADNKIVLIRPTKIKGSIIDGKTGKPLPRFTLRLGAVWDRGNSLIWQPGDLDKDATKTPGSFEHTLENPAHQYVLRVSADGYLAEETERFTPDGTTHSFTLRLTPAEPIRGSVLNPDGSPATRSFVYLVAAEEENTINYLKLRNGDVSTQERSQTIHAKTSPDGRFSLPPQKANFSLVVLGDSGFAIVPRHDLRGNDVLRLRPWARVSGTVTLGGKPAANLGLFLSYPDSPCPIVGEPRIERRYDVETDAEGRFNIRRAMPGRLTLGRWTPNGIAGRIWFVSMTTLDVESGKTYETAIGRSGRRVEGRLKLPTADTWMIRKAEIVSNDSREKPPAPVGVQVFEDGRFQADDLRTGDYTLRIALHEPPPADGCGWGRLLGEFSKTFSVQDAVTDRPLDLGVLRPDEVSLATLAVGAVAPEFTVKTIDGKDLKLADFRGKFVLLDFWATWCAPCVAEIPNLKAIHDRFSNDPRFVLISLNVDERPDDARFFVERQKLGWVQGFAGADSPVVSAYGASAIPAKFLIGPDGKILDKDFRGEKTKAAIASALQR